MTKNIAASPAVKPILSLFPHRFDWLWAKFPTEPTDRPEWKTESNHPLSDRQIEKGKRLYGVSFGSMTHYAMLDIDPSSAYHPKRDRLAIDRMIEVLEPLGITNYVAVQSSYRGGIHVYLPYANAQASWAIALVVQALLSNAGFCCSAGQLEIFPNPKPYLADEITHYKAHRLPLQIGSSLLSKDWDSVSQRAEVFVQRWQFAQSRNHIDEAVFQQVLKASRKQRYEIRGKAEQYLHDLDDKICPGWTGAGQTNFLLQAIATRARVFDHILLGVEPIEGKALVDRVVEVATNLPGYRDFCGHQHEIRDRAAQWAKFVMKRNYPYMGKAIDDSAIDKQEREWKVTWNSFQRDRARGNIRLAVAQLIEQGQLPEGITARRKALESFKISPNTLYAHKDLWYPGQVTEEVHPVQQGDQGEENQETLEALINQEVCPVTPNEFIGDTSAVAASAPPEQEAQATALAIPDEAQGGVRGGNSTGLYDLDNLPSEVEARFNCAALLAMCCDEAERLGWSLDKLTLYALEVHGGHPQYMEEWDLDCLLEDLQRIPHERPSRSPD